MTSAAFAAAMRSAFGDRARQNVPLAPFTTFKVGGPADWLIDVRTSDETEPGARTRLARGCAR